MANARILEAEGAATVLEDKELDSDKLKKVLEGILSDPRELAKMRSGYDHFKPPEAARELSRLVMDPNYGH
jgi:UDP-N-acetylglucosamine:LPS N-acetylglucosamine transferase